MKFKQSWTLNIAQPQALSNFELSVNMYRDLSVHLIISNFK